MTDRRVRKTRKDSDGDITALCNDHADWSPRSQASAISDIEGGAHSYYVDEDPAGRSDVIVRERAGKKHLTTEADGKKQNNLDELPDC